jgi:hypothetical protein
MNHKEAIEPRLSGIWVQLLDYSAFDVDGRRFYGLRENNRKSASQAMPKEPENSSAARIAMTEVWSVERSSLKTAPQGGVKLKRYSGLSGGDHLWLYVSARTVLIIRS